MKNTVLLTLGCMLFITPLVANQAFAGVECGPNFVVVDSECVCPPPFIEVNTEQCVEQPVGGLAMPIPESELYGELDKQYLLWLIPTISAIGVGIFVIKRKF